MNRIEGVIQRRREYAVFPIVCADHCAHLLKTNFKEIATDGKKLAEVLEYCYRIYKYDMVLVFSDPYIEAEAMGCKIEFCPYPMIVDTPKNLSFKSIKNNRTKVVIESVELLKKNVDVPVFVSIKGPFTLASFICGTERFLKMVLGDENRAQEYLEYATNFQLKYLSELIKHEVNVFIGDPMASASVISPEIFKKFAFKPLKILIKEITKAGLISGIHICGDTKPIVRLLDQLDANILSIEDITLKTNTLKMGGVHTHTILNGERKDIKREIINASSQQSLILSTTCDVPVQTPVENIKAMVKIGNRI